MYWGLVIVSGIAFSCATEFIPEINQKLKLVPFTGEFRATLTGLMVVDYVGCWCVENVFKRLFSDYRPKDIAVRRPDQLKAEERRRRLEQEEADRKKEEEERRKFEEAEKKQVADMVERTSAAGNKLR
jgi:cation-transporting ATPase 13A1